MVCPQCDGEGVLWGILEESGVHKAPEIYFQCDYCEGTGHVVYTDTSIDRQTEVEDEELTYGMEEEIGWFQQLLDKWSGRE